MGNYWDLKFIIFNEASQGTALNLKNKTKLILGTYILEFVILGLSSLEVLRLEFYIISYFFICK